MSENDVCAERPLPPVVQAEASRLNAVRRAALAFPLFLLELCRIVLHAFGGWLWIRWVNHKRRVIHSDWMELEFAPKELQAEHSTVQIAVKQDWRALEFASEELKDDKEIVREAVVQSWRALRFASRILRADRELVLGAVQQSNGWALEFAAEELYQDPEVMREATTRLGGPLGLPLTPILTLTPVGAPGADETRTVEGGGDEDELAAPEAQDAAAATEPDAGRVGTEGSRPPQTAAGIAEPAPNSSRDVADAAETEPSSRRTGPPATLEARTAAEAGGNRFLEFFRISRCIVPSRSSSCSETRDRSSCWPGWDVCWPRTRTTM